MPWQQGGTTDPEAECGTRTHHIAHHILSLRTFSRRCHSNRCERSAARPLHFIDKCATLVDYCFSCLPPSFPPRLMSKPGSGGVASAQASNIARRERLRQLATDSADLRNDPYFMRNHLGSYECKLCLTLHTTEGSYLAHTQAKRHQQNLARRAAKLAADSAMRDMTAPQSVQLMSRQQRAIRQRQQQQTGTPGYRIVKQRDAATGQLSLLFALSYPLILSGLQPRHRIMSAFEHRTGHRSLTPSASPSSHYQYVVVAALPYQTVAFRIPNKEIDRGVGGVITHWSEATTQFIIQIKYATLNTLHTPAQQQSDLDLEADDEQQQQQQEGEERYQQVEVSDELE